MLIRGMQGIVTTPSEIAAEFEAINNTIESLNADINRGTEFSDPWVTQWRTFRREWKSFYDENKNTWWGSKLDKALEYLKRANDWRSEFENKKGGTVTAPKLTPPPTTGLPGMFDALAKALGGTLKVALIVGGVAIGGYVAYSVWEKRRKRS